MEYQEFLKNKLVDFKPSGFEVKIDSLNPMLFDWQKVLERWALYKGRAALFAGCGLGKTACQLDWARCVHEYTGKDIIIFAPLAVSQQTKREGEKFGIRVNVCKHQEDIKPGINITNYERLDNFDPKRFIGVVLDEAGIIKSFEGKYRNQIIESFLNTPYKLACTATPSPNDYTELGNTAEFLGVMTRAEMLSMFFINDAGDTGTWRLKGHVRDNLFWEWLASWAIMMQKPSDIGFEDNGFILPPLKIHEHVIPYTGEMDTLFVDQAETLEDRRNARIQCLPERVALAAKLANSNGDCWITWCNLNVESAALKKSIVGAIEIKGSDTPEYKESALINFVDKKHKVLVTKPRIAGFGMNLQHCHNMSFVGLSDSFEQLYQAIRRCWRFGQERPVNVHIITGEREGAVVANIKRKEADMEAMFKGIVKHMSKSMSSELSMFKKSKTVYKPTVEMTLPHFMR